MERERVLIALATLLLLISGRGPVAEAQNCTGVTAPSEPQNVAANAVSFSCVDVSWMAPSNTGGDGAMITRYHITWMDGGSQTIEDGTSTNSRVMALTPETDYTFTVTAENNCNMMSAGVAAMATNTTGVVPAVSNVTARPVSSSAITVEWMYSTPECESVDRFIVTYSRDSEAAVTMPVTDVSLTSVDITGLQDMQGTYSISMMAEYQSATSVTSNTAVVIFSAPPPPTDVTSTATVTSGPSISVTWTAPVITDNRPPVTGYTVTAVPSSGGSPPVEESTTFATSTVLSGLLEGTTYSIEVVAVNTVGDSSAGTTSATTIAIPSVPRNLRITSVSRSSITVEWMEPADDGGDAITGYTITLQGGPGATTRTPGSSTRSATLTGLVAPNTYTVQVVAVNSVGTGPLATGTIVFQVPPPTSGVTATATSGSSISVTWTPPVIPDNGPSVTEYTVTAIPSNGGSTSMEQTTTSSSILLSGLLPDTMYSIQVVANNGVGDSPPVYGNATTFATPTEPRDLKLSLLSSSSIRVEWMVPARDGGDNNISYTIILQGGPGATTITPSSTNTTLTELVAPNTYTVQVAAVNRAGSSPLVTGTIVFQVPAEPSITDLTASSAALTVTWTSTNTNIEVDDYEVAVLDGSSQVADTRVGSSATTATLGVHTRDVTYTVTVTAVNKVGPSSSSSRMFYYAVPKKPTNVSVVPVSASQLNVSWAAPTTPPNVISARVMSYTVSWKAAAGGNESSATTTNTAYLIMELTPGTEYTVNVTAHNSVGDSDVGTSNGTTNSAVRAVTAPYMNTAAVDVTVIGAAVGASLVCVCLLAVVVALCFIVWRRRRRGRSNVSRGKGSGQMHVWDSAAQFTDTIRMAIHGQETNLSGSQQDLIGGQDESPLSTPVLGRKDLAPSHTVSLDNFVSYIENTSKEELVAQYRAIPHKTHDLTALALMNPLSNRYINILPYDKNRVILSEPNSDGNDYINASFIDGYDKEKAFIAAQGPLQRTSDDFWQMLWDQKVSVIVMLTKCVEGTKSKCAQYFPRKVGGRVFIKMNIAVECKSIHTYKDYEVRLLEVKNCKLGTVRLVHHFYYIGWPDFGVPDSPTGVLTMLHHVRAIRRTGEPDVPAITHCSAGVGRTGTFIALDRLVQQVQSEGDNTMIDIEGLVGNMRTQRGTMVQASEQYVFIHRALREYLLLGYTMMPGPDLKTQVEEMSPVKRHSGVSQFQEQYERLEYITAPYTEAPKVAEEFSNKIRFPDKGPYEGKYIRITPVAGDFSSSFINASLVDGYRQTKQFVVAQSPMHSTTGDFWALVYEKQSPTVILLCPLQENGEESSARFWPSEVGNTGNFVGYKVTCKSEDVSSSFTTHQLVVQPDGEDLSPLEVTLYHLEDWSAATMPKSGAVLSLLDTARAGQKEGSTSSAVVACNDGLGRSCLFVSLWILIEQLEMEDQVDVVGTFKSVRGNRPGAMDSLDYFIYCYHILMQYREMHNPTLEE